MKIGLIIGSTRPNRFADTAANWVREGAITRMDIELEVLDLRDQDLPFFAEPVSPSFTNGVYSHPAAEAWRRKIGGCDGFIATVAEYNHGPTAVLKNALDSAFVEWRRKPFAFVGYGGVGAARAIEQLRQIVAELQMAPIKYEVNVGLEPFLGVLRGEKALSDFDFLNNSRAAMFDDLIWWARALKSARDRPHQSQAAA
ncbi:MAG: NAD(P)H-dependent oxidoreductase [Pseudomonadota bacterium]